MSHHKNHNQSGISLMLSVLLLAAITAISFSFITIVFIELRSSRDLVRSEPALYATLGVTEEALFQYKRYVNERDTGIPPASPYALDVTKCGDTLISPITDPNNICALGSVRVNLPGPHTEPSAEPPQPLSEDEPVRLETVNALTKTIIPQYQVNDFTLQYGKITLKRVPANNGGNLKVQWRKISENPADLDVLEPTVPLNLAEGATLSYTNFLESYQYELILDNQSTDNIQVSIASFGPPANGVYPLKGLPFVGKKVLKINSTNLGLNRTYKVFIPVP